MNNPQNAWGYRPAMVKLPPSPIREEIHATAGGFKPVCGVPVVGAWSALDFGCPSCKAVKALHWWQWRRRAAIRRYARELWAVMHELSPPPDQA